jgi:adenine phosphoribosyltransferase
MSLPFDRQGERPLMVNLSKPQARDKGLVEQEGAVVDLASKIRDIPDFPVEGIVFRDITTLLQDASAFRQAMDGLYEQVRELSVDLVVGMESRGFIFAAPLAYRLGVGFVPVRKLGKLPGETISVEYELEYGTNTLEIHRDAIIPGQRVLIVDDLLATGGTVAATVDLVQQLGGVVVATVFLIELRELGGRSVLDDQQVISLINY